MFMLWKLGDMHILEQVPIDNYKNKVKKILRKYTQYDTIKMCLAKNCGHWKLNKKAVFSRRKLGTIEDVYN